MCLECGQYNDGFVIICVRCGRLSHFPSGEIRDYSATVEPDGGQVQGEWWLDCHNCGNSLKREA
jgi:hypothetical protein